MVLVDCERKQSEMRRKVVPGSCVRAAWCDFRRTESMWACGNGLVFKCCNINMRGMRPLRYRHDTPRMKYSVELKTTGGR